MSYNIFKYLTLALFSLLIIPASNYIHHKYKMNMYNKSFDNTFSIFIVNSIRGTAFAANYKNKNYTVTAAHVCHYSSNGQMRVSIDDLESSINILVIDRVHDICLLEGTKKTGLELGKLPELFSDVYYSGFPIINSKQFYTGKLLALRNVKLNVFDILLSEDFTSCLDEGFEITSNGANLQCSASFDLNDTSILAGPGASGSAVMDNTGKVVGVLTASNHFSQALISNVEHLKNMIDTYENKIKGTK